VHDSGAAGAIYPVDSVPSPVLEEIEVSKKCRFLRSVGF
jgi:hypothetical protein